MKAKGRNVCVIGNARGNSLVIVSDISNGDVALSQVSDLIVQHVSAFTQYVRLE